MPRSFFMIVFLWRPNQAREHDAEAVDAPVNALQQRIACQRVAAAH